jgi:DNA-directed RNA polymerase subunit M/transcription elongation factor TFIIS
MEYTVADLLNIDTLISLPLDVFYTEDYNNMRRTKVLILNNLLHEYMEYTSLSEPDAIELLRVIELSVFQEALIKAEERYIAENWDDRSWCDVYHTVFNKVAGLFDTRDSKADLAYLLKEIIAGRANPNVIAKGRISEICVAKYAAVVAKLNARYNVQVTEKTSELYRCPKCKENKCKIERMYTRALDEGQNIKITCRTCSHSWVG